MAPRIRALVERKVIRWTLAYLAAAWATLEAFGFLAELFGWGDTVVRVVVVLLAAGLPAVVVIAWYHGERGRQRVTRTEAVLLSGIAAVGVTGALLLGPGLEATRGDQSVVGLAVLPPTGIVDAPEAHFLTGMHETLISQLATVSSFRVISRRSTVRFANSELSLPEIAERLDVDLVVEATVQRWRDSVRVRAQLIEPEPRERMLWAGDFSAPIRHVVAMHGAIARTVAREARVDLTQEQEARLTEPEPVDPDTYEAYLRGMHALYLRTPESMQTGLEYLHEAVDRNPASALAYAGLAQGYATLGHGPVPPPQAWPRALEAAERAIALDPDLAEAYAALADVKLYYEWDWAGAERAFRKANRLNPSMAFNRYHYAWYLALFGRMDEAFEQHRLAKRLDPFTPVHTSAIGHLHLWERLDRESGERAVAVAREALELDPEALNALHVLGDAYAAMGEYEDAIRAHQRLVAISPRAEWILGVTYAEAGMEAETRRIRDAMEAQDPNTWNAFGLVVLNSQLGDLDAAFRWLRYEPHHAWVPWVRNSPWTRHLREDPRFHDFLELLGLPPPGSPANR
jgi:TolB-like protein/cytochrome c-type biogenesis protein CcmH/NrfG